MTPQRKDWEPDITAGREFDPFIREYAPQRAPLPDWTLRQRFIHWRLRSAREDVRKATMYRRQRPGVYAAAKAREFFWTNQWIATFRKTA